MEGISRPHPGAGRARYPAAVSHTVILSAARTPFGRLGGVLAPRSAVQLGIVAASAALQRAEVEPGDIDYAVIGQVVQAGAGHIPSRQVTLGVGVPEQIGSDTINKVCASGMRAIALADLMVRAGDRKLLLAGGMESMSNAPYLLMRARQGYRFGNGELIDANIHDGLRDPWSGKLMYEQASAVADELGLARAELDAWALRSHERAIAAIDSGRMAEEIVAVEVPGRGGPTLVDTDEAPRRDTSLERLAALAPLDARAPDAHRGQRAGRQRRRRDARRRRRRPRARAPARAARPHPRDRQHGQPPRLARARAGQGRSDRARARGTDRGRHGRDRDQRGVRVGRPAVVARSRRRRRARQRQRRRGRARPSRRRLGRAARGNAACTSCAGAAAGAASRPSAPEAGRATRS